MEAEHREAGMGLAASWFAMCECQEMVCIGTYVLAIAAVVCLQQQQFGTHRVHKVSYQSGVVAAAGRD